MFDSIHEECGVFGVFETESTNLAQEVYLGLYALQHRGQEACGIAICDDGVIDCHKGVGLVSDVFNKEALKKLNNSNMAIGHVRYSTTGSNNLNNVQPLVVKHLKGNLALVHNGNLTNASSIREKFELEGAIFHGSSDTEDIAYSIVKERLTSKSIEEAIEKTMDAIEGAYSCIAMSPSKLIAFRDPTGFRPLCLGVTSTGGYVISSESCAIDTIGAKFIRDIKPGEIVVISKDGIKSIETKAFEHKICIFEYIYFAREDSIVENSSIYQSRLLAGRLLSKEKPVDADVVIGVPDSGITAALGYSRESGIPFEYGFVKNKYIGRSFIKPEQKDRESTVQIKLNVIKESVCGKRVILVDDSIVRGTTSARIVKLLKDNGAKEVHLRVSAPPFKYPCFFGTDIDSKENLIACKYDSVDEIAKIIGADSLAYLSIENAHKLPYNSKCKCCDGCFSGIYPVKIDMNQKKNKFENKKNDK